MDRRRELKKGLKKTARYLLSHHRTENFNRCYSLLFRGKILHLCARCLGIYTGIFTGLALLYLGQSLPLFLVVILPLPTALEKFFTGIKNFSGYNTLRTLFGVLLGVAYIQALAEILQDPFQPVLLSAGFFYAAVAVGLIFLKRRK